MRIAAQDQGRTGPNQTRPALKAKETPKTAGPSTQDRFESGGPAGTPTSPPARPTFLQTVGRLARGPVTATAAFIGAAAAVPLAMMVSGDALARNHGMDSAALREPSTAVVRPQDETSEPAPVEKRLFDKLDRNGNGRIKRDEVVGYMKSIGVDRGMLGLIHNQGSKLIMKELDGNRDGVVVPRELTAAMRKAEDPDGLMKPENLDATFKSFDGNRDGKLSQAELQKAVYGKLERGTPYASLISKNVARFLGDIMDTIRDRKVSAEEFSSAASRLHTLRTENAGG